MAGFDFLHSTTYDPQLEQQDEIANMMASDEASQDDDPNNPEDLQEIQDQDVSDLEELNDDEHEEISDSDADKMATDTFDYENDQPDEIDYQLMGYLMGDGGSQAPQQSQRPQMQAGGGTYANAGTVYGPNSGVDTEAIRRLNSIKFSSLNSSTSKYQTPVPNTAGLREQADNFIENDPTARKMGITIAQYGAPAGGHSVRYAAGGNVSYEYNNPANRWQTGGAVTGINTMQQHIGKTRYNFPGMKMKMPIGLHQAGGRTLYANDDQTKRVGLNNQNYQRAVLNLKGDNTIRGLDNNKPVAVTDGNKYRVLHGPQDTETFNGKVYEKRL